ncbi:MAG TPA: hypothetical protein VH157_12365 [Bryobacteraceae bacterium]|nr:hypothetical protein [Bryobacteraceae bacterium]
MLGSSREHLDFSVWYLTENALITSSEDERYSITAKGVDHLEAEDAARPSNERLLAAGG